MDVRMPDGTIIKNVPEGTTKAELMAKLNKGKKSSPKKSEEGSFADPLMQGLTFGWADELGGLGARLGGWLAGADASRRDTLAERETGRQRARLSDVRETNPYSSAALEIGGSLVSGAPFLKLAKGGAGMLGLGVGLGSLAGAGAADEDKMLGAGLGAGMGGLMAGAVPAAGYALRQGGNMVANTARPIIERFSQAPATRAGRILGENLQAAGLTPAALRSRARQLGPDATLAEAAGEAGTALGQGVIGKDPTGRARLLAARSLGARVPGMSERLRGAVARSTSVSERLQPSLDAVRARQQQIAGPLYEKAYQQEIPLTPRLKNLLARSPMQKAFSEAKTAAETVGDELPPWFKMNDLGEWEKAGVMPDMRAWDRMKQGIDRLIDNEIDAVTGRMSAKGRDLTIMKNQLIDELDAINPVYANARALFAGDEAVQNAMRTGERFLTMKTRDVHSAVKSMNNSERESFLTGAVEAMREKIGRARSGEMGSFKFLEQENVTEKLRAIYPPGREGTRALAQLMRELRRERTLRETENALLKGSQTQLRDAASQVVGGQVSMPTGAEVLGSPVRSGIQRMVGNAAQALGRERQPTIDAMAEMLFSSGRVDQAIAELQRRGVPQQLINQYVNRFSVGSAGLSPAAGLFAGSAVQ